MFNKSDLTLFYNWNTDASCPNLSGTPDKSFFNKNEGNEVLYIINLLSFVEDSCDLERAENLIRNYMPLNIKSQIDVFNWLEINWELIKI